MATLIQLSTSSVLLVEDWWAMFFTYPNKKIKNVTSIDLSDHDIRFLSSITRGAFSHFQTLMMVAHLRYACVADLNYLDCSSDCPCSEAIFKRGCCKARTLPHLVCIP
ncbi:hypothetical protein TNCV_1733361 [Trichonephila clavipes]|nr:hypothetical protein TNCV_1733361 [Trichonephila clavipes]